MAKVKVLKPKQSQGATAPDGYATKDAQARFERAVDIAIATKPMHRVPKKRRGKRS